MAAPNFFLIGAPKCGTTLVHALLSRHPDVFLCDPKEPNFFDTDIASPKVASSLSDYLSLFDKSSSALAIGEASTTYLRSKVAVNNIRRVIPNPKFLVLIRNPLDMLMSVHAQLVLTGREDELDVSKAIELQDLRRKGLFLPRFCPEPSDLNYFEMCAIGSQLSSLYSQVNSRDVHIIFLDDIIIKPENIWMKMLHFLGVPKIELPNLEQVNMRRRPKNLMLAQLLHQISRYRQQKFPLVQTGLGSLVKRLTEVRQSVDDKTMPTELRTQLLVHFESEISLIEKFSQRDLSSWRTL